MLRMTSYSRAGMKTCMKYPKSRDKTLLEKKKEGWFWNEPLFKTETVPKLVS